MGAYTFMEPYLEWTLDQLKAKNRQPRYAGRAASAATATGQMARHLQQSFGNALVGSDVGFMGRLLIREPFVSALPIPYAARLDAFWKRQGMSSSIRLWG